MHGFLLFLAVLVAVGLRWSIRFWPGKLSWQTTLISFVLPPLLLISTSAAIAWMGCGRMFGLPARMGSHVFASLFLLSAGIYLLILAWQTWQTSTTIKTYPLVQRGEYHFRLLPTDFPYSAQVGLWSPQLLVSRGLLQLLNPEQIDAVLAHENAHLFYRDTWTFFWLGWLRRLTFWLPQTENLWQELLWQRECRADRRGAQTCDSLVLAEALALVAQTTLAQPVPLPLAVPFHSQGERLLARIDQLLSSVNANDGNQYRTTSTYLASLGLLAITVLPLVLIPLHVR